MTALEVATAVGRMSAREVNPTLYNLDRAGLAPNSAPDGASPRWSALSTSNPAAERLKGAETARTDKVKRLSASSLRLPSADSQTRRSDGAAPPLLQSGTDDIDELSESDLRARAKKFRDEWVTWLRTSFESNGRHHSTQRLIAIGNHPGRHQHQTLRWFLRTELVEARWESWQFSDDWSLRDTSGRDCHSTDFACYTCRQTIVLGKDVLMFSDPDPVGGQDPNDVLWIQGLPDTVETFGQPKWNNLKKQTLEEIRCKVCRMQLGAKYMYV